MRVEIAHGLHDRVAVLAVRIEIRRLQHDVADDPAALTRVLDLNDVYDDLDRYIIDSEYDVRCVGFDPYNAKEFIERWGQENGPFGIEKVIQGMKTETVPLGELKKLAEQRKLLFDEEAMSFSLGNCIVQEDTNGNRKLLKRRRENKIDPVSAMMDAYVAYKNNHDAFD